MKRSYKFFLLLSYKLNIKLFKKIESKIALDLIRNFDSKQTPQFNPSFRVLVFDNKRINTNRYQMLMIAFQILSVRALTRTLLFSSQAISNSEETYELSRFKLIHKVFKNRLQIHNHLLEHLSYQFLNFNEFSRLKELSAMHISNKYLVNEFKNLNLYAIQVFHKNKITIGFNSEDERRATIVGRFIEWDSRIFIEFLRRQNLELVAKPYLLENYPMLFLSSSNFYRVKYVNHEFANLTLDSLFERGGLEPHAIFHNAEIWHQRFVFVEDRIMNLDATSSPSQKFVAGCWQFGPGDRGNSGEQLILRPALTSIILSEAILLMGRCDENWYHFLLDTLPRLMFFENVPRGVPLLIRADLPFTSKEFLKKLTRRKVIEIGVDQTVKVSKLYACPGRSTVFDSSPPKGLGWVAFSPLILNLFRSKVLNSLGVSSEIPPEVRITFERKAATRTVLNWTNVHKVLQEFNFQTLPLDLKFFRKQVKFFYDTEFVVAPGGAVLANIIFMKPGTKVLVLRSWRSGKLKLWENLSKSSNLKYLEVAGFPTFWGFNFLRSLHSNYYISPRKLRRILSREI